MPTVDKFPIPGVSQPGQAGPAAPDSLLGRLRNEAAAKRAARTVTLDLHRPPELVQLRARYGMVSLDELERLSDTVQLNSGSNLSATLEILSRAVQAIEGYDPDDEMWWVLEDELGPVTFDDRLARLLGWDRPDPDFIFTVRMVYDKLYEGNGIAVGQHVGEVVSFMGLVDQEATGESTGAGPTRSAPPQL